MKEQHQPHDPAPDLLVECVIALMIDDRAPALPEDGPPPARG